MGLGQTQTQEINTYVHTRPHFFPPSGSESPNKGGKLGWWWSKNMVFFVIKVRVFVLQSLVPTPLIIQLSEEM